MLFVNNSDSKLSKLIQVIFAVSAVIGLAVQIMSLLAFTKTKLGKLVRKNLIGTMYDMVDESIDEAASRMPAWMKKAESISGSINQ